MQMIPIYGVLKYLERYQTYELRGDFFHRRKAGSSAHWFCRLPDNQSITE